MTRKSAKPDGSIPLADLQRAVGLCDAYESAWRAGNRPVIESFLADFGPDHRSDLLLRLLGLDLELRVSAGERPAPAEYLARFPDDVELVRSAFRGLTGTAELPGQNRAPYFSPGNGEIPKLLGDYELLDRLGRGGMGVVYRAIQKSADRIVALKLISPELLENLPVAAKEEAVKRFRREALSAAAMAHDNIVTVFDVGECNGQSYFAMQYVDGGTLHKFLSLGPLESRRAAALLSAVARAVDYAHSLGILHRDLKPSNVLVSVDGRPFVADFGLASRADSCGLITPSGALLGTPAYLAPEVITGRGPERFTPAGDIYSLGATLYEMLTGRPPFEASEPTALYAMIVDEDPPRPTKVAKNVHRDLETVCLKCLRKDPRSRYRSAADLAEDLDRFLAGLTIRARPARLAGRIRRLSRRPWAKTARAVLFILTVAIGAAVALGVRPPGWEEWLYHWEKKDEIAALASGHAIELIEPSEETRYLWRAGGGEVRRENHGDPKALNITTLEPSLFELLPKTDRDDYEVTIWIRQEECHNPMALVAAYVGHNSFETAEGSQHTYVRVSFADLGTIATSDRDASGRPSSQFELGVVIQGQSTFRPFRVFSSSRRTSRVPYRAPGPFTPPGPWRRIVIKVRGNRVVAECPWRGESVSLAPGQLGDDLVQEHIRLGTSDLKNAPKCWWPQGGLGLYIYGCTVSVREFKVRPLAPQDVHNNP